MSLIQAIDIYKSFGSHKALSGVSFSLKSGRITGLLGPNGAGKTTLLRIITNILKPDQGLVSFEGNNLSINSQAQIGYLPEERGLYPKITVLEQLMYFGRLKNMSILDARKKIEYYLTKFNLLDKKDALIYTLSKGNQQKVQFISALIHKPKLLILDEPFSGFDPLNAELFKTEVKQKCSEGTGILIATHRMELAENLCDEFILLNKGKIADQGTKEDLIKEEKGLKIISNHKIPVSDSLYHIISQEQKDYFTTLILPKTTLDKILFNLATHELGIISVEPLKKTLLDVFINNTK